MDPITSTVVAGVLWFVLGEIATVAIFFLVTGIMIGLAALTDVEWLAPVGVALAWASAVAFQIFVVIQVVIHVVTLIQLIVSGA